MTTPKPLVLAFTFLFYISGSISTNFIIKNKCSYTIWPGTLTSSGPPLSSTGFTLNPGASSTLIAERYWSGRFWARTHCTNDPTTKKFVCGTGDCGSGQVSCNGAGAIPPATLVEFTLDGSGRLDFYDVSLVDGYNLPVIVAPKAGCNSTSCPNDMNKFCPPELEVKDQSGNVMACKSACFAFNLPQYCCTGAFGTPQTCLPTSYSHIFKKHCPQAYSYAYDDKTSTFTCPQESTDYVITFCP